jgi:hypothetical protein
MTVYKRTAEGQWAAYSGESPLPRKMKILLKAINGSASAEVYAQSLGAFGDVPALLQSLQDSGLIEDIVAARRGGRASTPTLSTWVAPAAVQTTPPADGREPSWDETQVLPGAGTARHTDVVAMTPLAAAEAAPAIGTADAAEASHAIDAAKPPAELLQAIDTMSQFVLVHQPEHAFRVLPEIEALSSFDELAVLLDGYAQFAEAAGPAARAHVAELRQLVSARAAPHGVAEPTP